MSCQAKLNNNCHNDEHVIPNQTWVMIILYEIPLNWIGMWWCRSCWNSHNGTMRTPENSIISHVSFSQQGLMWHPNSPLPAQALGFKLTTLTTVVSLLFSFLRTAMGILLFSPAAWGTNSAMARNSRWFSPVIVPNRRSKSPTKIPASWAGEFGDTSSMRAKGVVGSSTVGCGCCCNRCCVPPLTLPLPPLISTPSLWLEPSPDVNATVSAGEGAFKSSNDRISPFSTPETDPSQFLTTHFPVLASNLGLGLGAKRAWISASSLALLLLVLVAVLRFWVVDCCSFFFVALFHCIVWYVFIVC